MVLRHLRREPRDVRAFSEFTARKCNLNLGIYPEGCCRPCSLPRKGLEIPPKDVARHPNDQKSAFLIRIRGKICWFPRGDLSSPSTVILGWSDCCHQPVFNNHGPDGKSRGRTEHGGGRGGRGRETGAAWEPF